jgi:hypothetical protein
MLMTHDASRPSGQSRGFALVVSLSLMVLLTVLAVGLLTLSTISVRSSSHGEAMAEAKANARLAIMLAVGDLQKFAGPDKRVTATSSILPGAPANDKWVGVWRTDGLKGEAAGTGIIRADARSGIGYTDRRSQGQTYKTADQCLTWLVSGVTPDPTVPLADADSVKVRSGSSPIRVRKTAVAAPAKGAFAYHVSDESTKARINLEDPYQASQPDAAKPSDEGMRRWLSPQTSDGTAFFDGGPLTAGQAAKVVSRNQLMLSPVVGKMALSDFRSYGLEHDDEFTTSSRSLLADPMGGGLKGDLTAYLENGVAPALGPVTGITDTTVLNGVLGTTRAKSGPKFGMLRNWYELRKKVSRSGGDFSIATQLPNTTGQGNVNIVDPGVKFVKPVIQPVMTEAVYYLNHVLEGSPSATRVIELIYPRVVLWNPFSVKMKTTGHVVLFEFYRGQTIDCTYKDTKGADFTKSISNGTSPSQKARLLGFYVPPTDFEPGEALTFSSPGGNRPFNGNDLRSNALTASASPADLGCFTNEWAGNTLGAVNQGSVVLKYSQGGNTYWNGNKIDGRTQTITLHALSGSGAATATSLLSSSGSPAVRQLSMDNFSRDNNGRWLPDYTKRNIRHFSDVKSGKIPPDSLLAYGGRFRFQYETYSNRVHGAPNKEPWYGALLAHHNINAPNIHRWHTDNMFGMPYTAMTGDMSTFGPHLYTYGICAQARQWSPWLDPEVMPRRSPSGSTYRTAVFTDASFATASSVYPVYDIPLPDTPLTSLGALQHVPLSPFNWHPTHAIGNSLPSPFVPLGNFTSNPLRTETTQWSDKVSKLTNSNNPDITGFSQVPNEVLVNDLSFELNQALWDRYFLSAIPKTGSGWKGDRWDPTTPLPNSRLVINSAIPEAGSQSELLDFHRSARALMLDGGFNVNSTSVTAWKSLLCSFRSVNVPGDSNSDSDEGAGFPGHLITHGSATPNALDASSDRFWRDYRKLSDEEIDKLAVAIVAQVKKRAPFLGVSDFVNRRLGTVSDATKAEMVYAGTLQAALDQTTEINDNGTNNADLKLPDSNAAANQFNYGAPYWGGPALTPIPQQYPVYHARPKGATRPEGFEAASQLTQADILQQLGPVLVARGDTFVIRACGEAHDADGNTIAKVWCEAVVQRSPVPITPDPATNGLNPLVEANKTDWGRRYFIESFRWLAPSEI